MNACAPFGKGKIVRRVRIPDFLYFVIGMAISCCASADNDHKPLPRPDLQPLSTERLQQIQGLSQSVITARDNQTPNPRAAALRQSLLDLRAEIGALLATTASPQKLSDTPCEPETCARRSNAAKGPVTVAGVHFKREALASSITDSERDPSLAHMADKARQIQLEVDAATQAAPEAQTAQLTALYRKLEPRATPGLEPVTPRPVEGTRHTFVHHQSGVRSLGH